MSKITFNRIALVAAFLTSLAAGIAGVAKTIPNDSTANAVIVGAGILGTFGTALTFAIGSWKWDQTPVAQAIAARQAGLGEPVAAANPENLKEGT